MQTFNTALTADADAIAYLEQIIDIDGSDAIVAEETVFNGSGRAVGTEYTVTDETATFIAECIAQEQA